MTKRHAGSRRARSHILAAIAVATLSLAGCDSLSPTRHDIPEPAPSSGLSQADFQTLEPVSAKAPKVTVCHFQAGQNEWKALSISGNAARAHLRNHDDCQGPGCTTSQTGTALDESCQPVSAAACPCWSAAELSALAGSGNATCSIGPESSFIFAQDGSAVSFVGDPRICSRLEYSTGLYIQVDSRFDDFTEAEAAICASQLAEVCSGL